MEKTRESEVVFKRVSVRREREVVSCVSRDVYVLGKGVTSNADFFLVLIRWKSGENPGLPLVCQNGLVR
jgi:hypothetical protein